ncbi:sialidase-3-like [Eublepharis macularius]|uniref:exo-alpha-sialidase n=1 Tax=Eublepharis macularius TaxID=481883 RepID=A0AA97J3T9_EUBMA|nr:sialidase-3-like [Eublepharis macularius]
MAETHVGSGKVTLFRQESPDGLTYRIPALLCLSHESTFLAFAEERSTFRNVDAKFLVMRRGQKEGTSVQWGPQESLMTAMLPDHRTMNPCPVYEQESGKVFLFFNCVKNHVTEEQQITTGRNAAKLCYVFSQDGGRTWSQLTDLTDQVIGDELGNWATFAVGPGHGVQLRSGRLVIPAYAYYIHKHDSSTPPAHSIEPHCFTFYSDDGGQHWTRGHLAMRLQTTECQVAELIRQDETQVLYCNARTSQKYRAEAFSRDDGKRFEKSFLGMLSEPPQGCQGSVVSFTPSLPPSDLDLTTMLGELTPFPNIHLRLTLKTAKKWLVFSHPTSTKKCVDLGIYLNTSPLEKGTWKTPWVIYEGPSGYSDLAVCEEGQSQLFGCLFECGVTREYEEIAFKLFTNVGLLQHVRHLFL